MSSREAVLAAIRLALRRQGDPSEPGLPTPWPQTTSYREIPRDHLNRHGNEAHRAETFIEVVRDYRAKVVRAPVQEASGQIAALLGARGVSTPIVPVGFPANWLPAGVLPQRGTLGVQELAVCEGVLTTCAIAIAETGTIVLDGGPGQGARAYTLLPDYHLCVVRTEQVVSGVPEAVAALEGRLSDGRPLTFVSGPSATSDIELRRVEGVHGPRTLDVLLLD